jgi:hypothetical protein
MDSIEGMIDPNSPKAILEKMNEVYSNAKSYQDTGVTQSIDDFGDRKRTSEKPFSIAFKRPSSIKVEWMNMIRGDKKVHAVVWSDGNLTQTFWEDYNQLRNDKSLTSGLAGASGVSWGAALTIPSMLMQDLELPRLSELTNLKLLLGEVFEGVEYYVISGKFPMGSEITVWVGEHDYLLRQSEHYTKSQKEAWKAHEAAMKKLPKEE